MVGTWGQQCAVLPCGGVEVYAHEYQQIRLLRLPQRPFERQFKFQQKSALCSLVLNAANNSVPQHILERVAKLAMFRHSLEFGELRGNVPLLGPFGN